MEGPISDYAKMATKQQNGSVQSNQLMSMCKPLVTLIVH